jgi:hypothetical protein
LLSKGDVLMKSPADFIGQYLGQSEKQTAAILEQAKGSVLVIDEAYSLHSSNTAGHDGTVRNYFHTAVIDTLVGTVQGVPGDDRCVLLLGYTAQMERMLKEANPGLARRFQLSEAFVFEDFSDDDLVRVLRSKAAAGGWQLPWTAVEAAVAVLRKERSRANFGNGGAVVNLLTAAIQRFEQRHAHLDPAARSALKELEAVDFDPSAGQAASLTSLESSFADLVGCDDVLKQLRVLHSTVKLAQKMGRDPLELVPMAYTFTGSPGTGKTTVAGRMGTLFHQLGLLSSSEVKQHSASEFSTGYIGQAGMRTRRLFEEALGGVLFIDEAYRLNPRHAAHGGFMQEVVDEIVNMLTEPKFKGKMILILAGCVAARRPSPRLSACADWHACPTTFRVDCVAHLLPSQLRERDGGDVGSQCRPALARDRPHPLPRPPRSRRVCAAHRARALPRSQAERSSARGAPCARKRADRRAWLVQWARRGDVGQDDLRVRRDGFAERARGGRRVRIGGRAVERGYLPREHAQYAGRCCADDRAQASELALSSAAVEE